MNTSGSEDWLQRLSVLFLMAMLVGYSANASAIDLGHHDAVPTSNVEHATEPVIDVPEATGHLIRRFAEAVAGVERPDGFKALVASTAFFMAGRGIRRACTNCFAAISR